ncbi:9195_t:CDS:1, partial [Gigaspora margarita]
YPNWINLINFSLRNSLLIEDMGIIVSRLFLARIRNSSEYFEALKEI